MARLKCHRFHLGVWFSANNKSVSQIYSSPQTSKHLCCLCWHRHCHRRRCHRRCYLISESSREYFTVPMETHLVRIYIDRWYRLCTGKLLLTGLKKKNNPVTLSASALFLNKNDWTLGPNHLIISHNCLAQLNNRFRFEGWPTHRALCI